MFSTARSNVLGKAISLGPSISLPSFLVPAFPASSRSFSASSSHSSQIGRAPLSIPPEVNFSVLPAPAKKNVRYPGGSIVSIDGPLGKLAATTCGALLTSCRQTNNGCTCVCQIGTRCCITESICNHSR